MSYAINVYAVSVERLKEIIGSRDKSMLDAVLAKQATLLSTIDDIDDEAEMTCADALAKMIDGRMSHADPGYLYGYALEALCAQIGAALPNICPISGVSDWIDEVDAVLESGSVPIRVCDLVNAGSPVPIPAPDDFPFIGFWPADEIPAALAALHSLPLAGLAQEMAETLAQIRDWLEEAAKSPGTSLIGFNS
jgi:hypothetical protein